MKKLKQLLAWLDHHLLLTFTGFLIIFIPLYPKKPLFDAIPGYIVRVRLEDVFVLLACLVWLVQVIRKKVKWRSLFFWLIASYALVGLLSVVSALTITQTVPLELIHLGKTLLHYFRYLEYFALFVITFSAIKTKKQVTFLMTVFSLTIVAISIYGYGQKYFYWPVFSTMNREFSKGMTLYLTEHARVQSTFAGHYDLAAYLVIALSFILAQAYKQKNKWLKLWFHLTHLIGLWLLLMTASRASFVSYVFGALIVILLVSWEEKQTKAKISSLVKKTLTLTLICLIMLFSFGNDMYERFLHILEGYPQLNSTYHDLNAQRKEATSWILIQVGLKENEEGKLVQKPKNAVAQRDVLTETDERPTSQKPSDVYVDVPDQVKVATKSADGSTTYVIQERERTWSENALKYGLSIAIRLDTLWPNAIKGFMKNPLLGSGYATLNKEGKYHFTEAESTDNNFLRILGETGALGFITYFGIISVAIYLAYKFYQVDGTYTTAVSIGFIGASFGLLLNATYIDVFAASKVAFTYWTLTGIVVALYYLDHNKSRLKNLKLFKKYLQLKTNVKKKLKLS